MLNKEIVEKISSNPDICHGKPCIKGTRIPVYLIVSMIAEGEKEEDILKNYPSLTKKDIQVALKYASKLCEYESYAI